MEWAGRLSFVNSSSNHVSHQNIHLFDLAFWELHDSTSSGSMDRQPYYVPLFFGQAIVASVSTILILAD